MARNRTRAQKSAAKRKFLNQFQEAVLQEDGRVLVRSTLPQPRQNFGVISALGRDLNRLLMKNPPYLDAVDREYLIRESLPLYSDRPGGVVLY